MREPCGDNMAEVLSYAKREYPAALTPIGSDDGIPASGYFSLHFTYPDTAYEDPTSMTFAKDGTNQLGINYMIRTPLAGDSTNAASTGEDARNGANTVVIDLKRAAEAHAASIAAGAVMPAKTFDLGTEEAARLIAATINSTRNRQIGAHSRSRYLRARYVKMSGSKQYGGWYSGTTLGRGMVLGFENGQRIGNGSTYLKASGNFATTVHEITTNVGVGLYLLPNENLYTTNNEFIGKILEISGTRIRFYEPIKVALTASSKLRGGWLRLIQFGTTTERDTVNDSSTNAAGFNHNLIPTDMPKRGTIVGNPNTAINDSAGADVSNYTLTYDGWEIVNDSEVQFNITKVESTSAIKDITDSLSTDTDDPTWLVNNDTDEQHTVVVSWEIDTPTGGGYWGTANGGPVVQGLGASLPVWYLTAKPMDGGNMGLPAANADSRGASPLTHTTGHGYSRFSIEGLNSCSLPDMPPPDKPFDGPVVAGSTEADPFQWTGLNDALNAHQEDNLLITKSEFGTQMDDGGPFQTNCMVSTNANITGGTTIKLLTPATKISSQFNDGDVIYAADKTALGTIAAGGIAEITDTALTVVGPKSIDTGVRVNHGFGNTLNGDQPLGGNRCYNAHTFYAWYHATGSLSTLRTGGVAPNAYYEPGDEITNKSDQLIGSVPICRTVKRQAPGAGGTIGSRVHIADGNDLFSDANRDIKSFTVDTNDPNLIYHVGEKLYAEDIYYNTGVTLGVLAVPDVGNPGTEILPVGTGADPTSAGYDGVRIKPHDRIYKKSGGNMVLIGTVKTVVSGIIELKSLSATYLAANEPVYVHSYIGTIKSMQETQHKTSVYGFLSGTVANNSTTTLNFSTNDTTVFTRRVLPGSKLENNAGTLVGTVSSVGDRSITLEANNAVALNVNSMLHVRGNSEWAIELENKLHFDNGAGHEFYNDVANTTTTGQFRLIDDLRLRAESVSAQSITISNLAANGSGDSSLSGTILRSVTNDERLFSPAVNYQTGVNNQGALNTQAADWKYLQTHHDDGNNTGSRYLIVKSTAGVKSTDKETYGGSLMMNYADTANGNPATLIGKDGKEYGTISSVLDERAVTVGGTTFTYSRIKLATCVADIPEGTDLYRAAPTITLTSAISGNTLRHGQMLFKGKDINKWQVALENGHKINSRFPKWNNAYGDQHAEITSLTNSDVVLNKAIVKNGLKSEVSTITASTVAHTGSQGYVHRPFRTVRAVNTERVKGLQIPNEAMVWENIELVDDTGAELILEGGSPFGTVIKDYNYKQNRIDPKTNTTSSLPSTPGSGLEPNLEIQ